MSAASPSTISTPSSGRGNGIGISGRPADKDFSRWLSRAGHAPAGRQAARDVQRRVTDQPADLEDGAEASCSRPAKRPARPSAPEQSARRASSRRDLHLKPPGGHDFPSRSRGNALSPRCGDDGRDVPGVAYGEAVDTPPPGPWAPRRRAGCSLTRCALWRQRRPKSPKRPPPANHAARRQSRRMLTRLDARQTAAAALRVPEVGVMVQGMSIMPMTSHGHAWRRRRMLRRRVGPVARTASRGGGGGTIAV